jgi:hypothetical protein
MGGRVFWKNPNPKKKSRRLTASQKQEAERRAQNAGRSYPNLVDNAAVIRKYK